MEEVNVEEFDDVEWRDNQWCLVLHDEIPLVHVVTPVRPEHVNPVCVVIIDLSSGAALMSSLACAKESEAMARFGTESWLDSSTGARLLVQVNLLSHIQNPCSCGVLPVLPSGRHVARYITTGDVMHGTGCGAGCRVA